MKYFGFTASSLTASISVKLFIPSALCTVFQISRWRVISLDLVIMYHFEVPNDANNFLDGWSTEDLEILYEDNLEQDDLLMQRFPIAESIGLASRVMSSKPFPTMMQLKECFTICVRNVAIIPPYHLRISIHFRSWIRNTSILLWIGDFRNPKWVEQKHWGLIGACANDVPGVCCHDSRGERLGTTHLYSIFYYQMFVTP
jgi:hypothetical protein